MTVCESFCKSLKRHEAVVPKTESRNNKRKTRWTLNTSVNTRKLKDFHFTLLTLFPIVSQTYSIKKHLQKSILKKKSAVICASLGVFFTKNSLMWKKFTECGILLMTKFPRWSFYVSDRDRDRTKFGFPFVSEKRGSKLWKFMNDFHEVLSKNSTCFLFLMKNCWKNVTV